MFKSEELTRFFGFENSSYLTDINFVNLITDHYICDYANFKDLKVFHEETYIDLDEFMEKSCEFRNNFLYNYYCSNITCSMESSRLMEDLLGYMERRIKIADNSKSYKAPKMVIDMADDTVVGPMQMFMKESWKNKPEYGINTQYCGFACNIYFELYKTKDSNPKYYVFYYIDDELKHIFEYVEFFETIKNNIFSQSDIEEYCKIEEEQESDSDGSDDETKADENENTRSDNSDASDSSDGSDTDGDDIIEEEEEKDEDIDQCICVENDSFSESFKKHTALWMGFFITCFTTLLGILGIIFLVLKLRKKNNIIDESSPKMQELTSNFMKGSDVNS